MSMCMCIELFLCTRNMCFSNLTLSVRISFCLSVCLSLRYLLRSISLVNVFPSSSIAGSVAFFSFLPPRRFFSRTWRKRKRRKNIKEEDEAQGERRGEGGGSGGKSLNWVEGPRAFSASTWTLRWDSVRWSSIGRVDDVFPLHSWRGKFRLELRWDEMQELRLDE